MVLDNGLIQKREFVKMWPHIGITNKLVNCTWWHHIQTSLWFIHYKEFTRQVGPTVSTVIRKVLVKVRSLISQVSVAVLLEGVPDFCLNCC